MIFKKKETNSINKAQTYKPINRLKSADSKKKTFQNKKSGLKDRKITNELNNNSTLKKTSKNASNKVKSHSIKKKTNNKSNYKHKNKSIGDRNSKTTKLGESSLSEKLYDLVHNLNRKIIALKVKPNSTKTEICDYDPSTDSFSISVAAPSDKNKANIILIKYISRLLKKRIKISSGASSKNKLLKVID